MSFDLGHWDVPDMSKALSEAYGMVERELMSPEDFYNFGFGHSVQLYAGANPDFFQGTILETAAQEVLQGA